MAQPIVQVENLDFAYGDTHVLSDVNFSLFSGDFVGVIGPNGGGKTTLLKLLLGFLKPKRGTITLLGEAPQRVAGKVGYVPQRLPFDRQFPITVMDVVLTGRLSRLPWYGIYSEQDCLAAKEALARVSLTPQLEAPFGTLSGGQAQRALIARAIVSEPQLLLLDEPTSSVDVKSQADIYQILKSLRKEMTIIMVTHDLTAVMEQVQSILCVQGNVFPLERQEVCKHFAYGLYHTPLVLPEAKA
jgi:zinc transport system ATP-binding protein